MLIIDRIEEGRAVCEDEDGRQVILTEFPDGVTEGDVLVSNESGQLIVDSSLTDQRRKKPVELSRRIQGRRRNQKTP